MFFFFLHLGFQILFMDANFYLSELTDTPVLHVKHKNGSN